MHNSVLERCAVDATDSWILGGPTAHSLILEEAKRTTRVRGSINQRRSLALDLQRLATSPTPDFDPFEANVILGCPWIDVAQNAVQENAQIQTKKGTKSMIGLR
jgi:hypothetical protein